MMNPRINFRAAVALALLTALGTGPAPCAAQSPGLIHLFGSAYWSRAITWQDGKLPAAEVRVLKPGPHLFLDDYLIDRSVHLKRTIHQPRRDLDKPVVTGPEHKNWQPYLTVLRDDKTGRFRMWYNAYTKATHWGYLESNDGVHWPGPPRLLDDPAPIQFGATMHDDGPGVKEPAWRYRTMWWKAGLWMAHSADGLAWTVDKKGPVLTGTNDIVSLTRDPIRGRYLAVFGFPSTPADGYRGKTPNAREGYRRCVGQATSPDGMQWSTPRRVIKPDDQDEGITEFYSIGGIIARGDLLIGLLKVLRDDLGADPDGPKQGIGYTVLAWSRDGETWHRDRLPFLDRDPGKGRWDHAMAWGDYQLLVGEILFLYYGGYALGHKPERFTTRQIGLVRLRRDRYVGREAAAVEGTLTTPLVQLDGSVLTLNVDARGGAVGVRIRDEQGKIIPGFDLADAQAVTGDALDAPVRWKRSVAELRDRPVRLEFVLRHAKLFAFGLQR